MKKWYAIHTFSGQENNIKKHIEQMIEREGVQDKFGQILVPVREVVSTVHGRRRVSKQNLFPAYIVIEMALLVFLFRYNRARSIAFLELVLRIPRKVRSKSRTRLARMSASRKVLSRTLWASLTKSWKTRPRSGSWLPCLAVLRQLNLPLAR